MKIFYLIAISFAFTGCTFHTHNQTSAQLASPNTIIIDTYAKDESIIIKKEALEAYRKSYSNAASDKAFAQSEMGAWSWKPGRTTKEYAIKNALMGCRAHNKFEKEYPCKIININGEWVGE